MFKLETVADKDVFSPAVCSGLSPNSMANNAYCLKSLYLEVVPRPICRENPDSFCELTGLAGSQEKKEIS